MSMLDTIGAHSQPSSSVHLSASESSYLAALIHRFCYADDLSTYDPYDLWKTPLGFHVKNFYNCRPRFGLLPAGVLTIFDNMLNNDFRWSYRRMEYPVVRAFAALCLVNLYGKTQSEELLEYAKHHLQWLLANACRGYNGLGWGLGYRNAISKGLIYDSNTPLATMTPYALEAFVAFNKATNSGAFIDVIDRIFRFFDQDIQAMEEDEEVLATSYAPYRDRTVINASSYAMYSY